MDAMQRLSIVLALATLVTVYVATRAVQFFTQPTEASTRRTRPAIGFTRPGLCEVK